MFQFLLVLIYCVIGTLSEPVAVEPVCSKFDYEYKTLEAVLRVERHVEDMKKEMERIQDDVTKKLRELEKLKETQKNDFATLKQRIEDKALSLQGSVNDKGVQWIAFTVGNPTLSLSNNGVLLFKTVTTNVGGAYDTKSGEFVCPSDGIYIFVLTIATKPSNREAYCRIRLNNENVVISRSYNTRYTTSSNTVFLQLKKDDVVSPGDCYGVQDLYTDHSATSFSGVLISNI